MHRYLVLVSLMMLGLAGCGPKSEQATSHSGLQALAQASAAGEISTLRVSLRSESRNKTLGIQTHGLNGIPVAYHFTNGQMYARVDVPGAAFSDREDRIVSYDSTNKRARVLLKRTQKEDPNLSQTTSDAATADAIEVLSQLSERPFMKTTTDKFLGQVKAKSFEVSEDSLKKTVVQRKFKFKDGEQTIKLHFDKNMGAVTATESTMANNRVEIQTASEFTYATLYDYPDVAIPRVIRSVTKTHFIGDPHPPLEYPIAKKKLGPNDKLVLKPDEYIATQFQAAYPGEGKIDTNTIEAEETLWIDNPQINVVTPEFVKVGGR